MRGLVMLCLSTLAIAAPQGYSYIDNQSDEKLPAVLDHEKTITPQPEIEEPKSIQELPEVERKQEFSPHRTANKVLSTLEESHQFIPETIVPTPYSSYGIPEFYQNDAVISKQFYLHSAPEEEDEDVPIKHLTIGRPRRNYNVIFIQAPVKVQKPVSLRIIPAVKEDKTIVYVLSKKQELADVDAHIEHVSTTTSKPEVHFIKYKTQEEAKQAQEKIQAEFDRLGGSTLVSNEAVSPISSVIGSLDQPKQTTASASSENKSKEELSAHPTNNGYLPPVFYY